MRYRALCHLCYSRKGSVSDFCLFKIPSGATLKALAGRMFDTPDLKYADR